VGSVVSLCRPDATHREHKGTSYTKEEKSLHCPASFLHYLCSISFTELVFVVFVHVQNHLMCRSTERQFYALTPLSHAQ